MKKNIHILVALIAFLFYQQSYGQTTGCENVTIESAQGQPGEEVCVNIRVNDFTDVVSMQFGMQWDTTLLEFSQVKNFNLFGLGFSDFSFGNIINGFLGLSWFDISLQGQDVPSGDSLFQVCFDLKGPMGTIVDITFAQTSIVTEFSKIDSQANTYVYVPVLYSGQIAIDTIPIFVNTPTLVSICQIPPDCQAGTLGSIDIIPANGQMPYTFNWSGPNSFTSVNEDIDDLGPGTYYLTITDANNKKYETQFELLVTSPMTVSGTATPTACSPNTNGTISLNITNGNPPYTIDWDDNSYDGMQNLTGLDTGQYTVIVVDSFGCMAEKTFNIYESNPIISYNYNCTSDTTFDLGCDVVLNNFPPYTFMLSNGDTMQDSAAVTFAGLNSGTYDVTVTDAYGCIGILPAAHYKCPDTPKIFNNCSHLTIESVKADSGSQTCVNIRVFDFISIASMQFNIKWDTALLEYNTIQNYNSIFPLSPTHIGTTGANIGIITLAWFDLSLQGKTLPDSAILFSLCFNVKGGSSSKADIYFSDNPIIPEFSVVDFLNLSVIPVGFINGSIYVNPAPSSIMEIKSCQNTDCGGIQNGINLIVSGGIPPYQYLWSNGSTSQNLINPLSGFYNATVTDSNGQERTALFFIEGTTGGLILSGDSIICPNHTGQLTAVAQLGATITWSPDTVLNQAIGTNVNATIDTTTVFQAIAFANGCIDTAYFTMTVDEDCVWPGDTDTSGTVSNADILNIGLGMAEQGAMRPSASLTWTDQACWPWSNSTPMTNTNYKHADTDGNGIIETADTLAILLNWDSMHNFTGGTVSRIIPAPFYVEADTLHPNTTIQLPVILGSQNDPALDVYGIAFSLLYDTSVIEAGSAEMTFDTSWLGNLNQDMIQIQKDFYPAGRTDIGVTRIDGNDLDGQGQIGSFIITVQDDILFTSNHNEPENNKETKFEITNVRIITAQEEIIAVESPVTTAIISDIVPVTEPHSIIQHITIHPNPTSDFIRIRNTGEVLHTIRIYNTQGQCVRAIHPTVQNPVVVVEDLSAGMYMLHMFNEKGSAAVKMVVE